MMFFQPFFVAITGFVVFFVVAMPVVLVIAGVVSTVKSWPKRLLIFVILGALVFFFNAQLLAAKTSLLGSVGMSEPL